MSQNIYLIDAYNFAHKAGYLRQFLISGSYEQLMRQMAGMVQKYLENKSAQAKLVFDNNKAPASHRKMNSKVEVIFTKPGLSADAYIIDFLRRQGNANIIVISSDYEIINAARDHQAVSMKSESFYALLVQQSHRKTDPSEKPGSNNDDIDSWLKLFGEQP
jgi:predicted RNA-binding protein with PIN domain